MGLKGRLKKGLIEHLSLSTYACMSLTTNDVSHSMIETHLLDSDLNSLPRIRVINEDYKASNFGDSVTYL